jgi:hypothetical protein
MAFPEITSSSNKSVVGGTAVAPPSVRLRTLIRSSRFIFLFRCSTRLWRRCRSLMVDFPARRCSNSGVGIRKSWVSRLSVGVIIALYFATSQTQFRGCNNHLVWALNGGSMTRILTYWKDNRVCVCRCFILLQVIKGMKEVWAGRSLDGSRFRV